jgi:hypothetical protein
MGSFAVLTLFSGRPLMHLRSTHVRRTLALALAVPALLAGCSDDPEPTPKIPEPTSSSPAPTPTESETAEAESPEEFIRRWQAAALKAQNEGDTTEYRAFGPKCKPCSEFADQVDRIYADGGAVRLASLRVVSVKSAGGADQFRLTRVLGRTRVLNDEGEEQQSFEGGREVLSVFLAPDGQEWSIENFLRTTA